MLTAGTWFFSALKVVAYHHPLLKKEIIFEDPKDPARPYELRRDKLCPDVAAPFLPNQKSENLGPYLDERCMVSSAPAPAPLSTAWMKRRSACATDALLPSRRRCSWLRSTGGGFSSFSSLWLPW